MVEGILADQKALPGRGGTLHYVQDFPSLLHPWQGVLLKRTTCTKSRSLVFLTFNKWYPFFLRFYSCTLIWMPNLKFKSRMEFNTYCCGPPLTITKFSSQDDFLPNSSKRESDAVHYMPANLEHLNLATIVKNHRQFINKTALSNTILP